MDVIPQTYSHMHVPEHQRSSDLMKWQLSTFDLIEDLEHDLKGERFSKKKNDWIKTGTRFVNDAGVKAIMSILTARINKNTILSNLTEKEISRIMLDFSRDLIDLFFTRRVDFDIKKEDLDILLRKIVDFVYISLKRAFEEGERAFLKQTERRTEVYKVGDEEKKGKLKSFWSGGN